MAKPALRSNQIIRARARALRQQETSAETLLWQQLRSRRHNGFKWRRQHPIGRFIVDFCCVDQRLIVELDGIVHADQVERDNERTTLLEQQGYRVLRFTNDVVEQQIDTVLKNINQHCIITEIG